MVSEVWFNRTNVSEPRYKFVSGLSDDLDCDGVCRDDVLCLPETFLSRRPLGRDEPVAGLLKGQAYFISAPRQAKVR